MKDCDLMANKTVFRAASPIPNYVEHSFPNVFGISKVTIDKKIHTYCRLGGDVYTNQIKAWWTPGALMCDYVYIDKAIEECFEQTDSIIEEVLAGIVRIIKNQCPSAHNIHVESYIDDSVPKNMPVKVEIDAD